MSLSNLSSLLKDIIKLGYPELIGDYNEIHEKTGELSAFKNRIAHRLWHPGQDGKIKLSNYFMHNPTKDAQAEELSLDGIYDKAEAIMAVQGEIMLKILTSSIRP